MKRHPNALMESRMRGNSHVRFGGRRRGNHRPKAGTGASPSTLRARGLRSAHSETLDGSPVMLLDERKEGAQPDLATVSG